MTYISQVEPRDAQKIHRIVTLSPLMWERYQLLLQKQEEVGGFSIPLSEMGALWNLKKTAAWHVVRKLTFAGLVKYRNRQYRAV